MTDYYVDIHTPEPLEELGPAANPSSLADLLAEALRTIERQGSPEPPYTVYAKEDGKRRGLTTPEQEALNTALEQRRREGT